MTFPIICRTDGSRFTVQAVRADLVCPSCKTGAHLDLDEVRVAVVDPSDPMRPLPGGVPDQDAPAPLVDAERERKVKVQPGAAPYTQVALETPVNARQAKVSTLAHKVMQDNPGLGIREAYSLAEEAVTRYPVVARTFYDREGNPSDEFVSGAPLDYSTEGTTAVPAKDLTVGTKVRSWGGLVPFNTITSILGASPFTPPERYLISFDDGSQVTLHKDQPLYVEG